VPWVREAKAKAAVRRCRRSARTPVARDADLHLPLRRAPTSPVANGHDPHDV